MKRFGLTAVTIVFAASCGSFTEGETSTPDGGGGTSEGGALPPAEDCFDGQDDNGDGKRDCEEPTCASYARCVPGPSSLDEGWSGYVSFVENGDCPGGTTGTTEIWAANASPATCSPCTCEPGLTCTGDIAIGQSLFAGCQTTSTPFTLKVGTCGMIPSATGGTAKYWQVPYVGTTKCTPKAAPPILGDSWYRAKVCTGTRVGAGCPAGQVCASTAAGGFGAGTCISRPHPGGPPFGCPSAFPVAHLVLPGGSDPASGFVEKRTCSECTCGQQVGASCNAKLTLSSNDSCTAVKGSAPGGACSMVDCGSGGCGSGILEVSAAPGTCQAKQGAAIGNVELQGPGQQLCCDR